MENRTISHYRLLERIGQGGMGEVYRATDIRLKRLVAIKILAAEFSLAHDHRARFLREAQSIAALNHPHICTIHDIGHDNGIRSAALFLESVTSGLPSGIRTSFSLGRFIWAVECGRIGD
jgi:eukaryotic-like serine/threonine-protein kinase